ncbi:MAG TPA: hypothetical protein VHQ90_06980 [Thermoanaerobaculia bacterium]|nr:hypothetical protein [Thermoanaerobaculia bacterium]
MQALSPHLGLTLALGAIGAIGAMACSHPGQVRPKNPSPSAVTQSSARPVVPLPSVPMHVSGPAAPPAPRASASDGADFAASVRPLLEARCQPCHFPGGKVYGTLPFDRAATILRLREKLFTRIKDERERQAIRDFLARQGRGSRE